MADCPEPWEHDRGYDLNADGKSIEYTHEGRQLRAIVEAMVNEDDVSDVEMEYYSVVFDVSDGKPWAAVEGHETFVSRESAKSRLYEMMEEHA